MIGEFLLSHLSRAGANRADDGGPPTSSSPAVPGGPEVPGGVASAPALDRSSGAEMARTARTGGLNAAPFPRSGPVHISAPAPRPGATPTRPRWAEVNPLRWLRTPIYNHPDAPRRWTWLLVATGCLTLGSWLGGRTWW